MQGSDQDVTSPTDFSVFYHDCHALHVKRFIVKTAIMVTSPVSLHRRHSSGGLKQPFGGGVFTNTHLLTMACSNLKRAKHAQVEDEGRRLQVGRVHEASHDKQVELVS